VPYQEKSLKKRISEKYGRSCSADIRKFLEGRLKSHLSVQLVGDTIN